MPVMITQRGLVRAAAILAGCAAPAPRSEPLPAPVRTVPFRAVDEPTAAVAGRPVDYVAGVVQVGEDAARVLITERVITGGVSERPETIAAGLAYGDQHSNNWRTRPMGPAISVRPLSRTVTDTLRDTLVLTLPLPRGVRLEEHWLRFKLWGTMKPPGMSEWAHGFRSLHTRPDLFR
jgi:hypothetical protein